MLLLCLWELLGRLLAVSTFLLLLVSTTALTGVVPLLVLGLVLVLTLTLPLSTHLSTGACL